MKCEIIDRDEILEKLKVSRQDNSVTGDADMILILQPQCVLLEKDHEEKAGIYEFKKKELIGGAQ